MPRRLRHAAGGCVYHVLNRSVARATIFQKPGDYDAFIRVLIEAQDWIALPLLGYCIMPNHWHLVLWPEKDGDVGEAVIARMPGVNKKVERWRDLNASPSLLSQLQEDRSRNQVPHEIA